jgi:hypothetical protein
MTNLLFEPDERRQFGRVTPVQRIRGAVGNVVVYVLDVSLAGVKVAHQDPLSGCRGSPGQEQSDGSDDSTGLHSPPPDPEPFCSRSRANRLGLSDQPTFRTGAALLV